MTEQNQTTQPANISYAALKFDAEGYRNYVRDMGLSCDQEDALLEAIWLIVVGVLDAAHGFHLKPASHKDENPLVPDSDRVLRSIIITKEQRARDARAEESLNAAGKDS
jgi:hypothetical protein